jgi:hypothetical protein
VPELKQVDPFCERDGEVAGYRSCDFCYQTAVEDIWAGKLREEEWRKFYLLDDGCCVCDCCLPLLEVPAEAPDDATVVNRCPVSFPHPPHDYCDGSPSGERAAD